MYTNKGTEIIIDLIGPIIDISKIADFRNITPNIRYFHEDEIASILYQLRPGGRAWRSKDIIELTKEALKGKSKAMLVDKEVLKLLCKAKSFSKISIISSAPDADLFKSARHLLTTYSKHLCKEWENESQQNIQYRALEDSDFHRIKVEGAPKNLMDFINEKCKKGTYRIVFDDNEDIDILANNSDLVQKWISGANDDKYLDKLKEEINRRWRINELESKFPELIENKILNLSDSDYRLANNFNFYVFDPVIKERLVKNIKAIQTIITERQSKDKPICVFLAGSPGTGKTFFVKKFAEFVEAGNFPLASLSGVHEIKFYDAVRKHIDTVYRESNNENKTHIAFLDEVDTKAGIVPFRFLMDAMTGDLTNEDGVLENRQAKNLIWMFAGSAGSNREEFIAKFQEEGNKVRDFFDRVHFDLILPSVDNPGQAILTFLSSLIRPPHNGGYLNKITVSKSVLNLFGRTVWKSAREIKTICRVACAKPDLHYS